MVKEAIKMVKGINSFMFSGLEGFQTKPVSIKRWAIASKVYNNNIYIYIYFFSHAFALFFQADYKD